MANSLSGNMFSGLSTEFVSLMSSKNARTDKYERIFGKVMSDYQQQVRVYNQEENSTSRFNCLS